MVTIGGFIFVVICVFGSYLVSGGSIEPLVEALPFELWTIGGAAIGIFHVNDYPALPAETIVDADRVYPGDGVAPLTPLLRDLREIGFSGVLSLELFNAEYYRQDPLTVARTGLEKLRDVVQKSFD